MSGVSLPGERACNCDAMSNFQQSLRVNICLFCSFVQRSLYIVLVVFLQGPFHLSSTVNKSSFFT